MNLMTTEAPRVLIVDDQAANVLLLERLLENAGSYRVQSLTDSRSVMNTCSHFRPDMILLDLHMPHFHGFQVLEQLEPYVLEENVLPIVVLTADITPESRRRALALGATDFLTKPFDKDEVMLRVKNLMLIRILHRQVQDQNRLLEDRVRERTRELEEAQTEILERLAIAAEYRDDDTGQHIRRVGDMAADLAQCLGRPDDEVERLRLAAQLHDLGKIGTPDSILGKPGKLTDDEFAGIRSHCAIGGAILSRGRSEIVRLAEDIALTHHERWDGSGYPRGLKGTQIPLSGRIVAVAVVFDALTSSRPYKEAWTVGAATEEIKRLSGTHFDPAVADALLQVLDYRAFSERRAA